MRVLVIGGSGLPGGVLGYDLARRGWGAIALSRTPPIGYDKWVRYGDHHPLDVALERHHVDLIVNAAAMASREECRSRPDLAIVINADLPGIWADIAKKKNIPFVQISTDAVFPGNSQAPFAEVDAVKPPTPYGVSKNIGGNFVRRNNFQALIVRTNFFAWSQSSLKGTLDFFVSSLFAISHCFMSSLENTISEVF